MKSFGHYHVKQHNTVYLPKSCWLSSPEATFEDEVTKPTRSLLSAMPRGYSWIHP